MLYKLYKYTDLFTSTGKEKFKQYCSKCGSKDLYHSSMWNGGWNLFCNQATSRTVTRCNDCGDMVWGKSDDEYEKSLPEWCVSWREVEQLKNNGSWEAVKRVKKVTRL